MQPGGFGPPPKKKKLQYNFVFGFVVKIITMTVKIAYLFIIQLFCLVKPDSIARSKQPHIQTEEGNGEEDLRSKIL